MCGGHIIFTWCWVVMEGGMCGGEVIFTWWCVVVEGRGDVWRSYNIYLVLGGDGGGNVWS